MTEELGMLRVLGLKRLANEIARREKLSARYGLDPIENIAAQSARFNEVLSSSKAFENIAAQSARFNEVLSSQSAIKALAQSAEISQMVSNSLIRAGVSFQETDGDIELSAEIDQELMDLEFERLAEAFEESEQVGDTDAELGIALSGLAITVLWIAMGQIEFDERQLISSAINVLFGVTILAYVVGTVGGDTVKGFGYMWSLLKFLADRLPKRP